METALSADGTTLAYDRLGDGPPVILIGGATCTRGITASLAEALAAQRTVINFDRRARGDSDDRSGPPYDKQREIEDLAALIDVAGGHAALYGHSSGAAVALHATVAGLPVDRLIMHDAPYLLEASEEATAYHTELHRLLAAGQPGEAVAAFMGQVGMPEEMIAGMKASSSWPAMESVGYSLAYDSAAMGDRDGGGVPYALLGQVRVPTLVLVGGEDFAFMIETAQALHAGIVGSRYVHLAGAGHEAGPEIVAPSVLEFLTRHSTQ